ncbi:MAG TPA: hypothetical protein VGZ00_01155 [Candidatus Baltobacteraceae bacterium]|jgi:hypothetical protein|nr:hypothetical protein [Candidatus Baltobacteraceae bacterium]
MTDAEHWLHLQALAKRVGTEFPDAIFIGGLAVFAHAERLGSRWQEASHDVDFYISLIGRGDMRQRYDMKYSRHLHKDSVRIEHEDFDVYTEHQNNLAIPYRVVARHSLMAKNFRVASLEHLMVLKVDAALDRVESSKGEKDLRDLTRILTLLTEPQEELIIPYLTPERQEMLQRVVNDPDILGTMGLNAHEAGKYRRQLSKTVKALMTIGCEGDNRARTP